MKKRYTVTLGAIGFVCGIAGCTNPYHLRPDESTAQLKSLRGDTVKMCKDGQVYDLSADAPGGYIKIPANTRISIGVPAGYQNYPVIYTCTPFLSFVPQVGALYLADASLAVTKCRLQLVKQQTESPTGLAMETSLGAENCSMPRTGNPAE